MEQILTVAKKEYGDAVRNYVFVTFLMFLVVLTGISLYVGAVNFQVKVSLFEKTYQALIAAGQPIGTLTRPEFFPLQLLRATIEYLEIIGAIMAISLGYLSIAKEKGNNTLPLIFTRPITRKKYYLGKLVGNAALLTSVSALLFLTIIGIIVLVGGVHLSLSEVAKILFSTLVIFVYLSIFFLFAALCTILMRFPSNALILTFVVWMFFVLIVPQIGDTMDTDNQVPGGFFNAIHVDKPQSKIILQQFTLYETLRNGTEETSITKHYERFTFALLGIKDMYNGKSLGYVFWDKRGEILWLMGFLVTLGFTSLYAFARSKVLWQKVE
ncbi:MAG: ABC transporter permease [Minisyncoccota bacterium]